jgi:hypothetical protein
MDKQDVSSSRFMDKIIFVVSFVLAVLLVYVVRESFTYVLLPFWFLLIEPIFDFIKPIFNHMSDNKIMGIGVILAFILLLIFIAVIMLSFPAIIQNLESNPVYLFIVVFFMLYEFFKMFKEKIFLKRHLD